jgi:hypothetical protein
MPVNRARLRTKYVKGLGYQTNWQVSDKQISRNLALEKARTHIKQFRKLCQHSERK